MEKGLSYYVESRPYVFVRNALFSFPVRMNERKTRQMVFKMCNDKLNSFSKDEQKAPWAVAWLHFGFQLGQTPVSSSGQVAAPRAGALETRTRVERCTVMKCGLF